MKLMNNTSFRLLEQGLDAVWLKQKVISQNIANKDTPDYKARTVNFSTVFKEKCNNTKFKFKEKTEDEGLNLAVNVTRETGTNQTFNGNNVDAEKEGVALADAQIQYEMLINKINHEFSMIRSALSK